MWSIISVSGPIPVLDLDHTALPLLTEQRQTVRPDITLTTFTNSLFSTDPAAAPQEVLVSAMSSTELLVEWMEVPAMDENGEITNYEIRYDPLMTFDGHISTNITNTSGPALMVVLMDLQEDVEYSISVRAYTSTGPGPFSDPVSNRTLEDGELDLIEETRQHTYVLVLPQSQLLPLRMSQ